MGDGSRGTRAAVYEAVRAESAARVLRRDPRIHWGWSFVMTRKSLVIVLAVVLVSAPLLGPAATGISAADATQSSPDGMVGVPDSNISMEVPDGESVPLEASDLQDRIYVDQYASSLEVVVTTPEHADEMLSDGDDANVIGGGEVAVVVRDSEYHSGRDIAVDASLLKNTLGYSPEMLYGTHSSGDTWRSPARYEDGYLQFHVEKFSSNAVTFSGEVSVTGTYGDDSSVEYNLSELDSASDPTVNLTGHTSTESETESGVGDGTTEVGGNAPASATLELTNNESRPVYDQSLDDPQTVTISDVPDTITYIWVNMTNLNNDFAGGDVTYETGSGESGVVTSYEVGSGTAESGGTSVNLSDPGSLTIRTNNDGIGIGHLEVRGYTETFSAGVGAQTEPVTLGPSETTTVSVSGISPATREVHAANASWTLNLTESTQTTDAGIGLNTGDGGAWANHSGVLSDGETVSLDLPQSALQEGTNTLDVAAGDGSLSADAPAPKVDVEYSHDAAAEKSVDYVSEQLSERYNVSHTYATDREDASLTVPFATDVVELRSVEKRVDGGSWETVPESDYQLDGTTMDVSLGSVDAETRVDVRAVGGTVDAQDMSIDVLEPSDPGERLDSKIEVSNVGPNPRLDFGDRRITYAYDETWTGEDSARLDGDGQTLQLPNAGEGGTFRVSTIPVEAAPQTGDVDISVSEAKTTEPTFNVDPGASSGDDVDYTYLNAQDGEPYILYSVTDSVVHDDGTASSPITLEDDDSSETLQFQIDNGTTNSSDDGDDGRDDVLGPIRDGQQQAETVLNVDLGSTWLLVIVGGGMLMLGAIYWRSGSDGVANTTSTTASGLQSGASWSARSLSRMASWFGSHPYISAALAAIASLGLVASGVVSLPQGAGTFLLVVATPAIAYVVLVQQLGASPLVWGILTAVSVVLGFQLLGTDVFSVLADSQAFPILAVGGVYLAYQAIQTYRASSTAPEEENTIVFDTGDDGNGGGGS